MPFPAQAIRLVELKDVQPGQVFRLDDNWHYRLEPDDDDDQRVRGAIVLTGDRAGSFAVLDAAAHVVTVNAGWTVEVRVGSQSAFAQARAVSGRMALGPLGNYLVACDVHGNPMAYVWGYGQNRWRELNLGNLEVVAAEAWRAILVRVGAPFEQADLFDVRIPNPGTRA